MRIRTLVSAAAAVMAVAVSAPLSAQGLTVTFVGEAAGDDVNLFLGEGTWAAGAGGISPVASLQTYLVTFDAGNAETGSIWSVTPAAGLRYGMGGGFLQGTVGYSFKQRLDDIDTVLPERASTQNFFGGAEDGIVVTGHLQWWGTGAFGAQGIVSHNFGSDYLWSRGRGTVRVSDSPSGDFHVGAEAGWQGEMGDNDIVNGVEVPAYSAVMAGPIVQWSTENVTAVFGGGWKGIDQAVAPEGEDSTWYIKAELVLIPRW